jgi:hypothetical protein
MDVSILLRTGSLPIHRDGVLLFHFTPRTNLPSIMRTGIKLSRSKGRRRRIWLCGWPAYKWAWHHVADHQRCQLDDMAVVIVMAPESALKCGRSHIYFCTVDIEPRRIIVIETDPSCVSGLSVQE